MEQGLDHNDTIARNRAAMKSTFSTGRTQADQEKGVPQPPPFKVCGGERVALTREFTNVIRQNDYLSLLRGRASRRAYKDVPLSLTELAFLLWSAQGVRSVRTNATFRVVPSGGARHPLELYLAVKNVAGLEKGLYHYLAQTHELELIRPAADIEKQVVPVLNNQSFTAAAAVTFFLTALPYRSEWRYTEAAGKLALLDAGHAMQSLCLSAEAAGLGMCAVAAYDQSGADAFLSLDGEEEFTVYAAAVGTL